MAEVIFGYGIHFEKTDDFVNDNKELINHIRQTENQLNWDNKTILLFGGRNWDVSYLVGVPISIMEYTSISFKETQHLFNEQNWEKLFNEKISKYPELNTALEGYKYYIDFQIILDKDSR